MSSEPEPQGEFAFIAALAKQLAKAPEALGLGDDGGVLWLGDGRKLVVVADMLQAGVHTMAGASPAQIASKALRANLSDLAAMGAEPSFFLSTIAWPGTPDQSQMQALIDGLAKEQENFGLALIGGDTISTNGPFTISITMLGWAPGPLLRRIGAKVGDDLWVSGTIGDGFLGLGVAQGKITTLDAKDSRYVLGRYEYPQPRLALGVKLAPLAHCALDISDGLIADGAHLASAGDCRLCIDPDLVPLSDAARRWLDGKSDQVSALEDLMAGGDDYEILFSASPDMHEEIATISQELNLKLSCIGEVVKGRGVVLGKDGKETRPARKSGFTHF